jgi:hypothetical protein
MPLLTRTFLKASLLYLVAGLLTGLFVSADSAFGLDLPVSGLLPVYFHMLMVGWISQLIIGVVFWMFPKYSREQPRRSESLGWVTFWLLNMGLLLRVISEPLLTQGLSILWGWLLVLSSLLQWLAGLAFVANTWSRIKEK